ncbi:MAG: hypothetical protein AABY22_01455 [Nanoarchaeota archaeon]
MDEFKSHSLSYKESPYDPDDAPPKQYGRRATRRNQKVNLKEDLKYLLDNWHYMEGLEAYNVDYDPPCECDYCLGLFDVPYEKWMK